MAAVVPMIDLKRRTLFDTFANLISGIGTAKDKTMFQRPMLELLAQGDLESMYRGDWISRKIVDVPAFDATRSWRAWQADQDQIEKLEEAEAQLGLQQKLLFALQRARLYGGSAIVMGVAGTGDFTTELDFEQVKKGSLKFVHVVERWMLAAGPRILDLTSPWFGEPSYYMRSNVATPPPQGGVEEPPTYKEFAEAGGKPFYIHPSRVIRLIGMDYPDFERAPDVWGDSVLQVVFDAIRQYSMVNSSISAMLAEAKLDVIKVSGLSEHLQTAESTNKLIARFTNANVAKSVVNALLLDKDNEEWDRKELSLAGFDRVMQAFSITVCGSADIPATRLFGREPAGQNSTGESDIRNYYDRVSSDQKVRLTPLLRPLDEVLIRHTLGDRDESIHYSWNPLWQESNTEKAAIELQVAQAHKIDVESGLINPDALRQARENYLIESGFLYPGIDAAIEDADKQGDFGPWSEMVPESEVMGPGGMGGGPGNGSGEPAPKPIKPKPQLDRRTTAKFFRDRLRKSE